MEACQTLDSDTINELKHYRLTPLRLLRGLVLHRSIKYVLKSSLMKLPIFSWGFYVFEFIPVERKWEVDETIMRKMLSTERKCVKSQQFAAENGLPVLKNVLLPKTRGFHACVEILRGSLDAGYPS
ncbi:hypothetical protein Tco_0842136 [Tanacetum coccineum]|uniref:Uncharacterized protein n=1 Tax=Tanacetum coccineum TaxID=301880 RepID=A0ABQ5B430_9ASTR